MHSPRKATVALHSEHSDCQLRTIHHTLVGLPPEAVMRGSKQQTWEQAQVNLSKLKAEVDNNELDI